MHNDFWDHENMPIKYFVNFYRQKEREAKQKAKQLRIEENAVRIRRKEIHIAVNNDISWINWNNYK